VTGRSRSIAATAERNVTETPPPRVVLAWAADGVGSGSRVRAVHRLSGGIAQTTHALTIDDAGGRRHRLVLQRWLRPEWQTDPGFDPAKEAAVLTSLEGSSLPAPRLVRVDPLGTETGAPALLMTRLPGAAPSVGLVSRPESLSALGATLARVHTVSVSGDLSGILPAYAPFGELPDVTIPSATTKPGLWRQALAEAGNAESSASAANGAFLHRDFHPGNTLWMGGRLTGIVDWTSASWGPPAADLAHLRINLVVLVGRWAAGAAQAAYESHGGVRIDARRHDLRTVFDFLSDAPAATTHEPILSRIEGYLEDLLDGRAG
jgi:aminoglycoside phosphotransferase (APT) family kinase protein